MKTLKEVMASLSPERRAEIEERAQKDLERIRIVRKLRDYLGFTQEEFADQIGVSQSRVSHLERDDRNPRFDDFARYVKALGGEWSLTVKLPNIETPLTVAESYNQTVDTTEE